MFQMTNTEREVFYIFLWLIGIIFVYTLVYTFILEPHKNHQTLPTLQTKPMMDNKISVTSTKQKKISNTHQIIKKEPIPTPIEEKKITTKNETKKVSHPVKNSHIPSVPKVPNIPSVPKVKSTLEKKQDNKTIHIKNSTDNIESTRQEMIDKLESSREETLKRLHRR